MGIRGPRIDAYIAQQKDFAKPILLHLRDVVHAACPDVEATLKWSVPFFVYRGGKAAMKLNYEGTVVSRPKRAPKSDAPVPPELAGALAKHTKAKAT